MVSGFSRKLEQRFFKFPLLFRCERLALPCVPLLQALFSGLLFPVHGALLSERADGLLDPEGSQHREGRQARIPVVEGRPEHAKSQLDLVFVHSSHLAPAVLSLVPLRHTLAQEGLCLCLQAQEL